MIVVRVELHSAVTGEVTELDGRRARVLRLYGKAGDA